MAPPSKRAKSTPTAQSKSTAPSHLTAKQASIQSFGTVSKAKPQAQCDSKAAPVKKSTSNKRKAVEIEDISDGDPLNTSTSSKRLNTSSQSFTKNNNKSVRSYKTHEIDSSSTSDFSLRSSKESVTSQESDDDAANRSHSTGRTFITSLPAALNQYITLHAAFLRAMSIHYAHNGATAPAALISLTSSVEHLWKKRRVAMIDYQRMLGLMEVSIRNKSSESVFRLVRSRAGIFVEMISVTNNASSGVVFDEEAMQADYVDHVCTLFEARKRVSKAAFVVGPASAFPLAPIQGSSTEANRSLEGQRRLASLKTAATQAQAKNAPASTPVAAQKTSAAVSSRTSSLLDRIIAKQAAIAASSAPTPEELTRQRGRQRAPEVFRILMMLRLQKRGPENKVKRVSSPLSSCINMIQDSAALPISEDEAELAIKYLADIDKPEIVSVETVGGITAVCLGGN